MRSILNLAGRLFLICLVAGLALGLTNEVTKDPIAQQSAMATDEALRTALPEAETFELMSESQGGTDCVYQGQRNGAAAGYVAMVTVQGYGGEIQVTVGMDLTGAVTGVNVGGANFKETVGLGEKTKDPAFTDQFRGLVPPLALKKDVIPVTSATISSRAVTDGVNMACEYLSTLLG